MSCPARYGDVTSDKFNAMPMYVVSTTLKHADGTRHTLRIVEQRLLDGGMLALRMTPATG